MPQCPVVLSFLHVTPPPGRSPATTYSPPRMTSLATSSQPHCARQVCPGSTSLTLASPMVVTLRLGSLGSEVVAAHFNVGVKPHRRVGVFHARELDAARLSHHFSRAHDPLVCLRHVFLTVASGLFLRGLHES